jgi:hypothetical protein
LQIPITTVTAGPEREHLTTIDITSITNANNWKKLATTFNPSIKDMRKDAQVVTFSRERS